MTILKSGALPAPVNIVGERTVGPSLGAEAVSHGLTSGIIGFLLVAFFVAVYYRTGGLFAVVALVLNLLFLFGILAAFGATLTLPGIAGIVLTLGMAVDANVLIYERIREELDSGKSMPRRGRRGLREGRLGHRRRQHHDVPHRRRALLVRHGPDPGLCRDPHGRHRDVRLLGPRRDAPARRALARPHGRPQDRLRVIGFVVRGSGYAGHSARLNPVF